MGFAVLQDLAARVNTKLIERGLAKPSEDGWSIPMDPAVRRTYLLVLAQLAREMGARRGLDLHPVTHSNEVSRDFSRLLELEPMPSRGQVVDFDLQVVGIDLTDIPLDDVLNFKAESGGVHRRYMQNLRRFALELSAMEPTDRPRELAARRAELEDAAADLRGSALGAWHRPKDAAGIALSIAGAAWAIATADPVPATLSGLGVGLKLLPGGDHGSAYSYLLQAAKKLR